MGGGGALVTGIGAGMVPAVESPPGIAAGLALVAVRLPAPGVKVFPIAPVAFAPAAEGVLPFTAALAALGPGVPRGDRPLPRTTAPGAVSGPPDTTDPGALAPLPETTFEGALDGLPEAAFEAAELGEVDPDEDVRGRAGDDERLPAVALVPGVPVVDEAPAPADVLPVEPEPMPADDDWARAATVPIERTEARAER